MKITKLNWISEAAKEAELTVSDGIHECLAFSQPCNVQENETLIEPLHAMDIENLRKVFDQTYDEKIMRINESYFSHYCVAKVVKTSESIVSVGSIIIQLESTIPSWANEGDLVEFSCSRLDIW